MSQDILSYVNSAEIVTDFKKFLIAFEKCVNKNQEQRMRFAAEPQKFFDSEKELFDYLLTALSLTADSNFVDFLLHSGSIESLVFLLEHRNLDIVMTVLKIFLEIAQPDTDEVTDTTRVSKFFEELHFQVVYDLLVRLSKESPSDELTATLILVFQFLAVWAEVHIRSMESTPNTCHKLVAQMSKYMCLPITEVSLEAIEAVAALVMASNVFKKQAISHIDVFVASLFVAGNSPEDLEYIENAFDCISAIALLSEGKTCILDSMKDVWAAIFQYYRANPKHRLEKLLSFLDTFLTTSGKDVVLAHFDTLKDAWTLDVVDILISSLKNATFLQEYTLNCLVALCYGASPHGRLLKKLVVEFSKADFQALIILLNLHVQFQSETSEYDLGLVDAILNALLTKCPSSPFSEAFDLLLQDVFTRITIADIQTNAQLFLSE